MFRYLKSSFSTTVILGLLTTAHPLTAVADIVIKPSMLDFKTVAVDACKPMRVIAENMGEQAIVDPRFSIENPGIFRLQRKQKCANPMQQGDTCRAYVNFCPFSQRKYEGELIFSALDAPIGLSGQGKERWGN